MVLNYFKDIVDIVHVIKEGKTAYVGENCQKNTLAGIYSKGVFVQEQNDSVFLTVYIMIMEGQKAIVIGRNMKDSNILSFDVLIKVQIVVNFISV